MQKRRVRSVSGRFSRRLTSPSSVVADLISASMIDRAVGAWLRSPCDRLLQDCRCLTGDTAQSIDAGLRLQRSHKIDYGTEGCARYVWMPGSHVEIRAIEHTAGPLRIRHYRRAIDSNRFARRDGAMTDARSVPVPRRPKVRMRGTSAWSAYDRRRECPRRSH